MADTDIFPCSYPLGNHATRKGNIIYKYTRLQATRAMEEDVPSDFYHVSSVDCRFLICNGLDDYNSR